VRDDVSKLVVEVKLWDARGNETIATPFEILRGSPPDPVEPDSGDDDDWW
jgi:hypothetical protein